jgi:hypothetical protein
MGRAAYRDHLQDVTLHLQQLFQLAVWHFGPVRDGLLFCLSYSHAGGCFHGAIFVLSAEDLESKRKASKKKEPGSPDVPGQLFESFRQKKGQPVAGTAEYCSFSFATIRVAYSPMPMPFKKDKSVR